MDHPTFHERRDRFESYHEDVLAEGREAPTYHPLLPCPCCGYPTLHERAIFEICELCWWEDDGHDDGGPWGRPGDPDRHSGPNHMTLREGRRNFEEHLHCDGMDRVVRGFNDPAAIELKRRAVEAFDTATRAGDAAGVDARLAEAERALEAGRKELRKIYKF